MSGLLLTVVVILAIFFTVTNGVHAAGAVVATCIASGAATPVLALLIASVSALAGALTFGSAVAYTVSSIIAIPSNEVILPVLTAALAGSITWNCLTCKWGLPASSTHSLVGGLIGSAWISGGVNSILWGWGALTGPEHEITGIVKIILALVLSPVAGFLLAFLLQRLSSLILLNAHLRVKRWINRLQLIMISILAFGHGANDSQKSAGLIMLALFAGGTMTSMEMPLWVKFVTGLAIATGTMIGGWPVMKTVGRRIYTVRSLHSLTSQMASAFAVLAATLMGAPVSTGQIIVSSVAGSGSADEYKMVNWRIGADIIVTWFITVPASATMAALYFLLFNFCFELS